MKRCLSLLVGLLGMASVANAQPPIMTPTSTLAWTQIEVSPAAATALTYRVYDGAAVTGTIVGSAVCTGTVSPYSCIAPIGSWSNGAHTATLTASNASGESPRSNPFTFTFQGVPATPGTFRGIAFLDLFPLDTWIGTDDTNRSGDTSLRIRTFPNRTANNVVLMQFALPSIPPTAVVKFASLFMTLTGADDQPSTYRVDAHKLTRPFDVSTATGFVAEGVQQWTPSSCCVIPMAQGDISKPYTFRNINKGLNQKNWDLTTIVQEWIANPATNFGLLLNADTTIKTGLADHFRSFASMESSDPMDWPYLRVIWAAN